MDDGKPVQDEKFGENWKISLTEGGRKTVKLKNISSLSCGQDHTAGMQLYIAKYP